MRLPHGIRVFKAMRALCALLLLMGTAAVLGTQYDYTRKLDCSLPGAPDAGACESIYASTIVPGPVLKPSIENWNSNRFPDLDLDFSDLASRVWPRPPKLGSLWHLTRSVADWDHFKETMGSFAGGVLLDIMNLDTDYRTCGSSDGHCKTAKQTLEAAIDSDTLSEIMKYAAHTEKFANCTSEQGDPLAGEACADGAKKLVIYFQRQSCKVIRSCYETCMRFYTTPTFNEFTGWGDFEQKLEALRADEEPKLQPDYTSTDGYGGTCYMYSSLCSRICRMDVVARGNPLTMPVPFHVNNSVSMSVAGEDVTPLEQPHQVVAKTTRTWAYNRHMLIATQYVVQKTQRCRPLGGSQSCESEKQCIPLVSYCCNQPIGKVKDLEKLGPMSPQLWATGFEDDEEGASNQLLAAQGMYVGVRKMVHNAVCSVHKIAKKLGFVGKPVTKITKKIPAIPRWLGSKARAEGTLRGVCLDDENIEEKNKYTGPYCLPCWASQQHQPAGHLQVLQDANEMYKAMTAKNTAQQDCASASVKMCDGNEELGEAAAAEDELGLRLEDALGQDATDEVVKNKYKIYNPYTELLDIDVDERIYNFSDSPRMLEHFRLVTEQLRIRAVEVGSLQLGEANAESEEHDEADITDPLRHVHTLDEAVKAVQKSVASRLQHSDFPTIDANSDDVIDKEEWKAAQTPELAGEAMRLGEANTDDAHDDSDPLRRVQTLGMAMEAVEKSVASRKPLQHSNFATIDANSDDVIDKEEWKAAQTSLSSGSPAAAEALLSLQESEEQGAGGRGRRRRRPTTSPTAAPTAPTVPPTPAPTTPPPTPSPTWDRPLYLQHPSELIINECAIN